MLRIAAIGAILAGAYGAVHDQVSFTISPEYFTKLKFHQFSYANFGLHPRLFAAEVGFLASWWVGLIAGWLLARIGLAEMPTDRRTGNVMLAFTIVGLVAAVCGAGSALYAWAAGAGSGYENWDSIRQALGLVDVRAFIIVAKLHNGSYAGALLGVLAAAMYVRSRRHNRT